MAMIVQHNLTAMNSNRMLGITTGAQAKSSEKLSSGYKINRAADDAAGLTISEKMRKQMRGLDRASTNAQDGVSAVQTAEGALTEVHDMLQRMNELAVKAANGTQSESDRAAIQAEIDQLTTEIDRVAETTKFNETYLLKGDRSTSSVKGYTYSYQKATESVAGTVDFATAGTHKGTGLKLDTVTMTTAGSAADRNALMKSLRDQGLSITAFASFSGSSSVKSYGIALNGDAAKTFDVIATSAKGGTFAIRDAKGNVLANITVSGNSLTASAKDPEKTATGVVSLDKISAAAENKGDSYQYYDKDGNKIAANDLNNYVSTTGGSPLQKAGSVIYDAVGNVKTFATAQVAATQDRTAALRFSLHVGADATKNNQITLNIESMSAKGLGIVGIRVDGKDDTNALNAIDTIKAAISKVSAQRSDLGAIQNRLEHTINNLDNVVENTTSAESAIRDTDMATTMVQYSNNNILAQAGTSMLAQANQSNQSVLSLLQ